MTGVVARVTFESSPALDAALAALAALPAQLEKLTMNQAQELEALNAAIAKVDKIAGEVAAARTTMSTMTETIAQLEQMVADLGAVPAAIVSKFDELRDKLQAVDEQLPDLPAATTKPAAG